MQGLQLTKSLIPVSKQLNANKCCSQDQLQKGAKPKQLDE